MIVRLKRYTHEPDLLCGEAAALCTGYTGDPLDALRGAMRAGHESVAEHASFTFHVSGVSRVLLAQLTRHRLASCYVCGLGIEYRCPECGTIFLVRARVWGYKLNGRKYCSHKCLRAAEKKSK